MENENVVSTEQATTENQPIIIYSVAFFMQGSDKPIMVSGDTVESLTNIINLVTSSLVPFVQLAQNADGGPIIINKDKITHIEMYIDQELTAQVNAPKQPVEEPVKEDK